MVLMANHPSDLAATFAFSFPHSLQAIQLVEVVDLGPEVDLIPQVEEELKEVVVILFMLIFAILQEVVDNIVPN